MVLLDKVRQKAAKSLETAKQMRFALSFINFASTGTTDAARKMEVALTALAKPEDFQKLNAAMPSVPALKEMFDAWYIPPTYTLDELKKYAPGTLGYAYYRHMTDNGLSPNYYPVPKPTDNISYFGMRAVQTHDLWHVLAGCPPNPSGEAGVVSFGLGQYAAHLGELAQGMMTMSGLVQAASYFYNSTNDNENLIRSLDWVNLGWPCGKNAKSLFAGQWESWWDRPLAELRREYNINPITSVYDFESSASANELVAVG